MQHFYGINDVKLQDAWVTIGSFDGVHIGHRQLIDQLTAGAHNVGAPAVVITFHPHPAVVLRGLQGPIYLTTPEQKAQLLGNSGVDVVITYPFSKEVSQTSAKDFVQSLHAHLGIKHLWIGHDFALGRNREGDVNALRGFGEELGFQVHEVSAYQNQDQVVSSSLIRKNLEQGDLDGANRLLDRSYALTGKVEQGDQRGRELGFPTANIAVDKNIVVPGAGIYASWVTVDGKTYQGASSIGVRPTFEGDGETKVETFILDFDQDIYDQEITITFEHRLRDELKFDSIEALVEQIDQDVIETRRLLAAQEVAR